MSVLYGELLKEVNNLDPDTQIDISRVCYTINNIHKNLSKKDTDYHYELIGSLIIHHKSITDKINVIAIPYDCQIMMGNKGILPTMNDLPILLQKIISQYVIKFSFIPNTQNGILRDY